MNDKVTPKLSKAEKQEVKQKVKDFALDELGFVLSFPEYGATVAVAPAKYAHDGNPISWNKAKFMCFTIAWLGEGDIFRRRTGQKEVLNQFQWTCQSVPVTFMMKELVDSWGVDLDNLEEVEEVLRAYFGDYVIPTFASRI